MEAGAVVAGWGQRRGARGMGGEEEEDGGGFVDGMLLIPIYCLLDKDESESCRQGGRDKEEGTNYGRRLGDSFADILLCCSSGRATACVSARTSRTWRSTKWCQNC